MDISAHAISLADRPRRAFWVTRVRTRREDRSSIVVSSSRRARRVRVLIRSSIASWLCAVPLFVPGGRSFVPTCGCRGAPRAGTVEVGRRACLASRAGVARPRLDGPEHRARVRRVCARFIGLDALEGAPLLKNRPGDGGELVGERNRQRVVVEALPCGLDPRLEPVAVPMLWPDLDQHDPGGLNEQTALIAIAALRYAAEDRAVAGR